MDSIDLRETVELGGIFSIPGEGLVVELNHKKTAYLYDKQGLQALIIKKQQLGLDTSVEQTALSQLNNISPTAYD